MFFFSPLRFDRLAFLITGKRKQKCGRVREPPPSLFWGIRDRGAGRIRRRSSASPTTAAGGGVALEEERGGDGAN